MKGIAAFTEDHDDIEGTIKLNNNLKIVECETLLLSKPNGRLVLRRMRCKPQADDKNDVENGATYTLVKPKAGEVVWFLLKLSTKKGQPIDGDTDNYGINITVKKSQQ